MLNLNIWTVARPPSIWQLCVFWIMVCMSDVCVCVFVCVCVCACVKQKNKFCNIMTSVLVFFFIVPTHSKLNISQTVWDCNYVFLSYIKWQYQQNIQHQLMNPGTQTFRIEPCWSYTKKELPMMWIKGIIYPVICPHKHQTVWILMVQWNLSF